MKLNEKHKQFCKELLKHRFNQKKAYQAVYKSASDYTSRVNASVLLTKTNIKAYLEKLKEKEGIKDLVSIEEVVSGIKEVLDACLRDPDDIDKQAALKSLEMLGRYKAMFTDKTINENNTSTSLSFQEVAAKSNE